MSTQPASSAGTKADVTKQNQALVEDQEFLQQAQDLFYNLNSTPLEKLEFIKTNMEGGELSPSKMFVLQKMENDFSQMVNMLTNFLRNAHDSAMSIVRNIGR